MKLHVCKKLAALLHFKAPPLKLPSPVECKVEGDDAGDLRNESRQGNEFDLGLTDAMKPLMKIQSEIRDLLRAKLQSETGKREMEEEELEIRNDWKLAAAVIDRLLLIVFSILFVGGTVIFFIVFALAPHSPLPP